MKLIILISFCILFSCRATLHIKEGRIYKTKEYVGVYIGSVKHEDYTFIQTTQGAYKVKAELSIPDSAWCYIRTEPCRWDMHPDIAELISPKYISWDVSVKEYRIY